jgi:hypothetical protein
MIENGHGILSYCDITLFLMKRSRSEECRTGRLAMMPGYSHPPRSPINPTGEVRVDVYRFFENIDGIFEVSALFFSFFAHSTTIR